MIGNSFRISVVLAVGALVGGYFLSPYWPWGFLPLGSGLFWFVGHRLRWPWIDSLELALFAGVAGAGAWLGLGQGWVLVGLTAALSAWDLGHFGAFLQLTQQVEKREEMERRHLRRLLVVDAVGLAVGLVALRVRIRLAFGWVLLLGLVLVLALGQVVAFLRREGD